MPAHKCWISILSRDYVDAAVCGSYAECRYGKRLIFCAQPRDFLVFYSPTLYRYHTEQARNHSCRAFTAIGIVSGDVYMSQDTEGNPLFRRPMTYASPYRVAALQPLAKDLMFIANSTRPFLSLREPILSIPLSDFLRIADAMGALETFLEAPRG